jgi:adenylyltransferase/sulfurtransferase
MPSEENHASRPEPRFTEAEYYARQTRLPEIGAAGQQRLRDAKVLVIGAGGLGSPALSYLAAAGIGTIGICEGDRLEASNLHRQTLYHYDHVGQPKAVLAAKRLHEQNPFVQVQVHEPLTPENVIAHFNAYDFVLDCTDNFATKFLINDAAVLTGTPAIFASIYRYEGQLMFVCPSSGSACMRCLWPEMPEPDCVGSCADVGVLGAVPGLLGTMQAMEAIKYFTGVGERLLNTMVIMDCLSYATQRVRLPRHAGCPVCGQTPRITEIRREEYLPPADININVDTLSDDSLAKYRIIDIREDVEVEAQPIDGIAHEHIAMSGWDLDRPPLTPEETVLLCCARGMRSLRLAEQLRKRGYAKVYSVQDGREALVRRAQ